MEKLEMENYDLSAFLCELGNRLRKEGNALQTLAKIWFGESGEEYYVAYVESVVMFSR
jgi:hypothetical protein